MRASLGAADEGLVLAAVIRSSLDCIIVVDDRSCVVEFNPAAEKTFGYARADTLGKPIGELIVPEHLRRAHTHGFQRYLAGGEAHVLGRRVEIEAVRSDGTIFPVELTITEVLADGQRLFTASLRDLSERRAAEVALRASEGRLAAFFDHVPNTMYLKDVGGRFIMANGEMHRRLGHAPGVLIGLRGADVTTADIAAQTAELEHRVREEQRPISVEQSFPLPDGSIVHTVVTRFPVPDAHGHMTNVGAMFIDLTQQKQAEIALRASEARFSAFMANAPIGMFLKDESGKIVLANAEMGRAYPEMRAGSDPLDVAELIGRDVSELLDGEATAAIAAQDADVLATNRPRTDEWHRPHLDRYAWMATVRFPVHIDGAPPQVGGFVIDLTARKAAEQALERSREALHHSEKLTALGSLLAGVSHELNNPLSAVIGQAMMLEEDAEGTAFAARAERIRTAAERCARIVEIFLAMARHKPPKRAAVAVNDVVDSALELLAYGLRASGIGTVCDLAAGLPMIDADADQLHQVVVNLVVNAQQALEGCPQPRELRLRTGLGDGGRTIEVEVADNGPGIPAADARRIFEPFFTTKPVGSGTGIGLSFSLGVIEAHGGRLRLREGGGGACFVIELPVEPAAAPAPTSAAAAGIAAEKGVALVVDDDAGVADALGELVERQGYAVEIVASGIDALARIRARDYDLLIADLRMPGLDGPVLFETLVRERPHLASRIGFVTGDVLSASAAAFLARAGRPYAEKPLTPAKVRALVAAMQGGGELRSA